MEFDDRDLEELKELLKENDTAPIRAEDVLPEEPLPEQPEEAEEASAEPEEDPAVQQREKQYENYTMLLEMARVLAVITVVFVFLVRMVIVDGSSMFPTLVDRDFLILESNFLYRNVEAGDVVVMNVDAFDGPIVKRVIATEGQEVYIDFEAGEVFVDGEPVEEPYIFEPTYRSNREIGLGMEYPLTVPEGCIFAMGDNRNHSSDSRYSPMGCVETERILGRVLFIAVPGSQTNEYGEIVSARKWGRIGRVS